MARGASSGTALGVGRCEIPSPYAVLCGCTAAKRCNQPNKALHLTAYSLRSFLAPAFGGR
jgi:hypothetical protein